jgi:hypothetical protein
MTEPFETVPDENRIVYVKTVDITDLPEEVQGKIEGLEHLYAVHNSEGEQLALVADRKLAFRLARQNDYAPVAVH